ncbi:MAG TPA: BTAD domain-containing putative transcriptional regulator [Steroidobacteraceae bacterium]|nr:BTAD domain-containing putative transcriptional regulator [Steroidobacteraceae bacterium]
MTPDGSFTIEARSRICIYTLGRFELVLDGVPVRFKGRAPMRALELLGALIAAGGRGVSVASLADALWPDADGFDAYRAFTTTLHRLRRLLQCAEALRLSAGRLTLDPEFCRVDLWEFERALRAAHEPRAIREALDLYHGPFLGDDPSPWALATRARLERLVTAARPRFLPGSTGLQALFVPA